MFSKDPMFQGKNNFDQLDKISKILGTKELLEYLQKYQIQLDFKFNNVLGRHPKMELSKLV